MRNANIEFLESNDKLENEKVLLAKRLQAREEDQREDFS